MTDQETKVMAELKAACETCAETMSDLLECGSRLPPPQLAHDEMKTTGAWIRLRAACHLACRAVAMADDQLTEDDVSDLRAIAAIGAQGATP